MQTEHYMANMGAVAEPSGAIIADQDDAEPVSGDSTRIGAGPVSETVQPPTT